MYSSETRKIAENFCAAYPFDAARAVETSVLDVPRGFQNARLSVEMRPVLFVGALEF
jgi:hypothetical protein